VLMIVNDALRRESASLESAETMSAAEMLRAMALYRQMRAGPEFSEADLAAVAATVEAPAPAGTAVVPTAASPPAAPTAKEAPEAIVTPIDVSRKRGDGPARG
ncbi:MAG TPA: hypothetical protein VFO41_08040, partial [Alphaproteobacteria bacterium]|nr:hypothetical protein [Alphaproteobacteria bacterium]